MLANKVIIRGLAAPWEQDTIAVYFRRVSVDVLDCHGFITIPDISLLLGKHKASSYTPAIKEVRRHIPALAALAPKGTKFFMELGDFKRAMLQGDFNLEWGNDVVNNGLETLLATIAARIKGLEAMSTWKLCVTAQPQPRPPVIKPAAKRGRPPKSKATKKVMMDVDQEDEDEEDAELLMALSAESPARGMSPDQDDYEEEEEPQRKPSKVAKQRPEINALLSGVDRALAPKAKVAAKLAKPSNQQQRPRWVEELIGEALTRYQLSDEYQEACMHLVQQHAPEVERQLAEHVTSRKRELEPEIAKYRDERMQQVDMDVDRYREQCIEEIDQELVTYKRRRDDEAPTAKPMDIQKLVTKTLMSQNLLK